MRKASLILCGLLWAGVAAADPSYQDELIQQARQKQLADQRPWYLLLHYRRNLFGLQRSEVDDPKFFLAPNGRKNVAAELEATVRAFFEPAPTDPAVQHPQCRFPARYAWLKGQLQFDPKRLPEQACERFATWRGRMDAESISVIFASYYMNNPASMYGHTFLRLNGRKHTESQRLLDYTVNYAADVTTNNGILFAVYGLTGGYRGKFSSMPYYVKVQEYNNMEERDLWEYPLTLSAESVERLVAHLWELGGASIAYFFLNKNCSYQLLPVLEVADPRLHLTEPFWTRAIPADTLRQILKQPGLVGPVQLRPSHVTRMLRDRRLLSASEIRAAEQLVWGREDEARKALESWPVERRGLVLDSAYNLLRYRVGFKQDRPVAAQEKEHRLLAWRNEVKTSTSVSAPPTPEETYKVPPHAGHRTSRLALSYGFSNRSHFEELSIRPSVHDQDDPVDGFLPGSQLQMFHLRLRHDNDRGSTYVQHFSLVDLISFSPWDRWVRHPSWKVNTGVYTAQDLNKDPEHSLYYGLNGGSGFSAHVYGWERSLAYAMAEMDLGVGAPFRDSYRWGGGGSGGVLLDVADFWRLHFNATYLNYPLGDPMSSTRLRLVQAWPLFRNVEFRATLQRQNIYKEVLLGLFWYL